MAVIKKQLESKLRAAISYVIRGILEVDFQITEYRGTSYLEHIKTGIQYPLIGSLSSDLNNFGDVIEDITDQYLEPELVDKDSTVGKRLALISKLMGDRFLSIRQVCRELRRYPEIFDAQISVLFHKPAKRRMVFGLNFDHEIPSSVLMNVEQSQQVIRLVDSIITPMLSGEDRARMKRYLDKYYTSSQNHYPPSVSVALFIAECLILNRPPF